MNPDIYKKMRNQESLHWWYVARRNLFNRLISKEFSPDRLPLRILEVGPGTGGNYELLKGYGEYHSLECSDISIDLLKNDGIPVTKGCLGCGDHLLSNESYDLICMLDVLEHIEDDSKALKDVRSTLKDDGILLVSVPAHKFLWSKHDKDHHHFRRYEKSELKSLLEDSGFSVKFLSYFYSSTFPLLIAERMFSPGMGSKTPFPIINSFLIKLTKMEADFILKFGFSPMLGSSIVLVASKN